MIPKISASVQNNQQASAQPNFKGGPVDMALSVLQLCEAYPMANVTVADLGTAIIPRTYLEAQTNAFAGLEAFRRESSGLFINCLIPGYIVAGFAKLLSNHIMGSDKTKMGGCWANEDTIRLVGNYWEKSKGAKPEDRVADTIRNILRDTSSVDGDKTVEFKQFVDDGKFDKSINELVDQTINPKSKDELKAIESAAKEAAQKAGKKYVEETPISRIVKQTFAAENIKIAGHGESYFSQGLGAVLENTPKILREMIARQAADPTKTVAEITKDFTDRASKLVKTKSLLGLGVIIPLAIAAQPINRWITEKTSGKKGAPIYKDFANSKAKEPTAKEKAELAKQKVISVGSMIGVALLSIMKKPNKAMWKSATQFKGIFPSMDQARIISTATFASRMAASEDKNDLREATCRDIATFSAFYFLGDYVAKGIASVFEKCNSGVKLINDLVPEEAGKKKNILEKAWHWTKNTALKSSDELHSAKEVRMRGICQLGNLGFSLLALGIIIPHMYRKKTDQEHEKEMKTKTATATT